MHTTWKVTEADRDAAGSIKVDGVAPAEPRSLADLLPTPQSIKADAARRPMSKQEMAALSVVALMAVRAVVAIVALAAVVALIAVSALVATVALMAISALIAVVALVAVLALAANRA